MQKKPTMYPEWKSTFDAHIYEGRVIQIVLMRAAEEPMSEVTVGVSVLAERCKKNNGKAEFWVRAHGLQHVGPVWPPDSSPETEQILAPLSLFLNP